MPPPGLARPPRPHPAPRPSRAPPSLFPPFTLAQELIGEPGTRIRVGTLDGAGACAGRAGCWEPLAPGSSFCWGPELQGSTSPSSTWSSTPRRAGQDECEVRRARTPPHPCARPSHPAQPTHGSRTFPPPCTAHAPPCTPRFHLTRFCPCVCAGGQSCPSTSTRVEVGAPRRRDGGGAPVRAGRPLGCPGGARSGDSRSNNSLRLRRWSLCVTLDQITSPSALGPFITP